MSHFDKPACSVEQHLSTLRARGLGINNEARVRHYLGNISYFRLSAYTRPFYTPNEPEHRFLPGTRFDNVLDLYVFDRELRLLLLDAIERLEVALLDRYPQVSRPHMGFPPDWDKEGFWKTAVDGARQEGSV